QFVKLMEQGKFANLDSPKIFPVLEAGYRDWLEGSPQAAWAFDFYGRTIAGQVETLATLGKVSESIARLQTWTKSPLWPKEGPPKEIRLRLGRSLLKSVFLDGVDGGAAM